MFPLERDVRIKAILTRTFLFDIKDVYVNDNDLLLWSNGVYRIVEYNSDWVKVKTVGDLLRVLDGYPSDMVVKLEVGHYVFDFDGVDSEYGKCCLVNKTLSRN